MKFIIIIILIKNEIHNKKWVRQPTIILLLKKIKIMIVEAAEVFLQKKNKFSVLKVIII